MMMKKHAIACVRACVYACFCTRAHGYYYYYLIMSISALESRWNSLLFRLCHTTDAAPINSLAKVGLTL